MEATITDLKKARIMYRANSMYLKHLEDTLEVIDKNPGRYPDPEANALIEQEHTIAAKITQELYFNVKNLEA